MKKIFLGFFAFSSLFANFSWAQEPEAETEVSAVKAKAPAYDHRRLFFQTDKNNIQVLPQKFEYTQIDEQRLQIGDIIIDSSRFGFQVSASKKNNAIKFVWPAGLLMEGSLVIKDNSGKALFSSPIKRGDIKVVPIKDETNEEIRADRAELVVRGISGQLVEQMKFTPYMQLCLIHEGEQTKIYLCSQDVYLSVPKDGKMRIRPRDSVKKTAFVQVNGKEVGKQGIIFLNDREENLSFRSLSESGASLEIETRMKDVDFLDVVAAEEEGFILLTASGAEPVNEESITRLASGQWQTKLNTRRPILFLKGEGGIPLRQEFFIRGTVPTENERVILDDSSYTKTYGSELTVLGTAPTGWALAGFDQSSKVQLNKQSPGKFRWTLQDIPPGVPTRRYLTLSKAGQKLVAGYDVFKASPFTVGAAFNYWLPAGRGLLDLQGQWWFENFLNSDAKWANFHWGAGLDISNTVLKPASEASTQFTKLQLHYRLTPGFNLVDSTYIGSAIYRQMNLGSESLGGLGVAVRSQYKLTPQDIPFSEYFSWWNNSFEFYLPAKSNNLEYQMGLHLETEGLMPLGGRNDFFLRTAAKVQYDQFKGASVEPQFNLQVGGLWQF